MMIIFHTETLKATIQEKKEEQVTCNTKIKELEANLADAKGYRDRQLKEAKDHMQKMQTKSDKSRKEWEKREKVSIFIDFFLSNFPIAKHFDLVNRKPKRLNWKLKDWRRVSKAQNRK